MPAELEHLPLIATGPSHETFTGGHADVSQSGDVFVQGEHRLESEHILTGPAYLRAKVRAEAYELVHGAREEQFKRNEILLNAANINVHDTDHQDRDARMVDWLFDVFADKLDQNLREPVLLGAMMHDREYIQAAENYARQQLEILRLPAGLHHSMKAFTDEIVANRKSWMTFLSQLEFLDTHGADRSTHLFADGSFPTQIDKKALDPHADLGKKRIEEWYMDSHFEPAFGEWDDQQRKAAAMTVRDHSTGSEYNPFETMPEVQLLRLADKLDNTYLRIRDSMLTKESLKDENNCHRYVPASIQSYALHVDRAAKTFTVEYNVDFNYLLESMHRDAPEFTYGKNDFRRDFQLAYGGKSMRIAAEVVHSLFADKSRDEMYSPDAAFQVRFKFADGSEETTKYEPLPTAPVYG